MSTVEDQATEVCRLTLDLMNRLRPWAMHGDEINRICVKLTLAILRLAGPEAPDDAA